MFRRHAHRARRSTLRTSRPSVEFLEGRRLMAELALVSAAVRGDGRIVELVFSGPATEPIRVPDWTAAAANADPLRTDSGVPLEPLGAVVAVTGQQLTWTSTFLVADPSRVITYGQTLTLSGPARLFDDGANWTAAVNAAPVTNGSIVDPNGFSTDRFTRGTGGVTVYVSSRYGNDARSIDAAQNPRTPLKSLAQALALLEQAGQDRRGAAVRLLRGDVFEGDVELTLSGQDRDHPFVLEDYWYNYGDGRTDPRTRPIIRSDMLKGQDNGLYAMSQRDGATLDYVVLRRLRIEMVNRFDGDKAHVGIKAWRAGTGWVIDDVVVDEFRTGIAVDDLNYARFNDVTLLRTVVTDSHANAVGDRIEQAKSQGLFAKNVDGLLVSQSTFDRNGRVTSDGRRNLFSHNMYIQTDCGPATVWGSVIRAGGSHGVQLRPGGILAYNYLGRNAIAGYIGGGVATRNVVELSENIDDKKRGWGLGIYTKTFAPTAALEFNIIVNSRGGQRRGLWVQEQGSDAVFGDALIRNNTLYQGGYVDYNFGPSGLNSTLRLDANLAMTGQDWGILIRQNGPWDRYSSDRNVWWADNDAKTFRLPGVRMTWDDWRQRSGSEASSVRILPTVVNPTASIATYTGLVGGPITLTDTAADADSFFIDQQRSRNPGVWTALGDGIAIYQFFATQYRPTNLTALGGGPTDFYGAVDYR
jgi:hypothetical protein